MSSQTLVLLYESCSRPLHALSLLQGIRSCLHLEERGPSASLVSHNIHQDSFSTFNRKQSKKINKGLTTVIHVNDCVLLSNPF